MDEQTVSYNTAKNWFTKFKSGDFNLNKNEHSNRSVELDESFLLELLIEEIS